MAQVRIISNKTRVVKLSPSQEAALAALVEQYDNGPSDELTSVTPYSSAPRVEFEGVNDRLERLKKTPVKALSQYRIRVPARTSSYRVSSTPTDATMKRLAALGFAIDHAHRDWAPTDRGREYLKGGEVREHLEAKPVRVEFTITPAQAVEERRKNRNEAIEYRIRDAVKYAEEFAYHLERSLADVKSAIEEFKADPRASLGDTIWSHTLTGRLYGAITRPGSNTRLDTISRDEGDLMRLFAEERAEEEASGLDLKRHRIEYPDSQEVSV